MADENNDQKKASKPLTFASKLPHKSLTDVSNEYCTDYIKDVLL